MKVNSSRNSYVIPDVKGNDTLAIPCILIGEINVAGNGRLRSKWYKDLLIKFVFSSALSGIKDLKPGSKMYKLKIRFTSFKDSRLLLDIQEDEELDCLISSFQRLNEVGVTDVQSMANKKRKSKPKKKKLVVGTSTAHQTPSKEVFGEDYLSQNIGALIGTYVDFAFCSSHGASGGILTIWDSRMFSIDTKFVNKNFLCVVRTWVGITAKVGLLNIYAPQSPALKDQLWSDLEILINAIDAVWIVFGDFNVVRSQDERFGCIFDTNEANSFNDFISRVGFIDFPLRGRRFTRFDKNGSKASKLDRFLVFGNFFDYWIDASVLVLYRSLSDHCPLLLKVGTPNFGPKPYRVFDKWFRNEDFKSLVVNSWTSSPLPLSANLLLKDKIKRLRLDIKNWTCIQMLSKNKVKEDLKKQLLEWDVKAEKGLINDLDVAKREEWLMDLDHLDQIHRLDLKQKCRIRWVVEGDENTKFFHSLLKFNNSKMNIKGININGVWHEDPESIKNAAFEHFSTRFKECNQNRPQFTSNMFRRLSTSDSSFLDSPFSLEEIKEAVWGDLRHLGPMVDPLGFSDYRPISLIGCVYKVLSKILSNRLAKVISSVISPNQSAFIAGRQILDGCLIANEVIRMAYMENLQLLLFKVDFEKAFDSVNWSFLFDIIRQMGFSSKWRKWMLACLSSASISVIVNGSPTKEFKLERGLRQGVYNGLHLVESGSNLSLLQYADDALFFGEWSRANSSNLIHILLCFELASGLKVNIAKSKIIGVGVPNSAVESLASSLGCSHEDKLSSWKAKFLSIGGRLTLVKSVLGGLGVGSLLAKNMGLLGKWKWRFLVEKNALWRMVIKDFYGIDGGFGTPYNSFGSGGIWCDIIKVVADISLMDPSFNTSFALKVSNGSVTSFWADPWCPNGLVLKDTFPRLFALETQKDCKVADRWKFTNGHWGGNWSWRLPPRGRAIDDLSTLEGLISSVVLESDCEDKWVWKCDASGNLKVKSLSNSIQNLLLANDIIDKHCLWISWIPRKVNICVWRASLDRLPTRTNLSHRGVVLPSLSCPLCSNALEEIDHCIIRCPRAIVIWRKVWGWWNLNTSTVFPSFSISDITAGRIKAHGYNARTNKVLQGVLYCSIWSIWNWRNRIVNADPNHVDRVLDEDIFASIQRVSKIWISGRVKSLDANWSSWIPKPFDIMSTS
ncbi:putative RNA-directed DNA polymerase [Tanacetum coccineum]